MSTEKQSMFVTPDGRNVTVTFILVSSLFLLWGFCNGMIDTMDKHFQEELRLSLSQSAWVQFAHWLGYFIMAMPAGWLCVRLGYRGGIIAGLLLVALGGFWFVPATKIAQFWAFLLGVCVVASGLTFLETVANPYTTVLGPPRYAATRINLAQSCNGVGWILGPIAAGLFFYGRDETGRSIGSETLWIPYAGVAVVVLVLAVIFFFAPMPDIKAPDDYAMDNPDPGANAGPAPAARHVKRGLVYVLLLGNLMALIGVFGMILWLVLDGLGMGPRLVKLASALPHPASLTITAESSVVVVLIAAGCLAVVLAALALIPVVRRLTHHSIWAHEHFSGATLAQFFYVAAQAGIFSFLINYVVWEPPSLPASWLTEKSRGRLEVRTAFAGRDFKDLKALAARLSARADPVSQFLATNLSGTTLDKLARFQQGTASATTLRVALQQDLNSLILKQNFYDPERFRGVALSPATKQLAEANPPPWDWPRLNRLLLADAYPGILVFEDGVVSVTNETASKLLSFGFLCFLIGRVTGAALLRRFSAHRVVGLYAALNVLATALVACKLGWLSVACVFASFFLMSIMFPTIFALGIYGLGVRAKKASAFIVMGIVGGAILPKLMGAVADHYDMSRGFVVPMICFALIALYGWSWPKLSRVEALHGVGASGGH
jgi:fucose permease